MFDFMVAKMILSSVLYTISPISRYFFVNFVTCFLLYFRCSDETTCKQRRLDANCIDIADYIQAPGTKCEYCCTQDNCNKPPLLLPPSHSLYTGY